MKTLLTAVAVVLLFLVGNAVAADKPLKIYILVGQSKMLEDPSTKPLYDKIGDAEGNPKFHEDSSCGLVRLQLGNCVSGRDKYLQPR